jgi:hypothetical protein
MMETMIPPQVGMRLLRKKRGKKLPNKKEKKREKEIRGNATIL